jgi:hypothetical protein
VIYLKSGSIIRGMIIEQVPNKSIKIETSGRNVFVYQMEEIEKITKELQQKLIPLKTNSEFHTKRYEIIEFAYQSAIGESGKDRIRVNLINSYRVTPNVSLGFGTGLRSFYQGGEVLVPVLGDFRINLNNNNFSPFVSLAMGYSFDATNRFEGAGPLVNPNIGINISMSKKSKLILGIGYEVQKIGYYSNYFIDYKNSNAVSLNIGMSF